MSEDTTRDLFIRPTDVLLFRDGRPFSAGDDHHASGQFPPAPSAFYGALRAAAFTQGGVRFHQHSNGYFDDAPEGSELANEMGGPAQIGDLAIRHFSLAIKAGHEVMPLFPVPADVLRIKTAVPDAANAPPSMRVVPTAFHQSVTPLTNAPAGIQLLWQYHDERAWYADKPAYITQCAFAEYLATGVAPAPSNHFLRSGDEASVDSFFATEPRTSVKIDPGSKTADEGMLFTVDFARANEGVGFALRLANASTLDEARLLRLGGEARTACIEPCELPAMPYQGAIREKMRFFDKSCGDRSLSL